jgi:putative oxidoreductase
VRTLSLPSALQCAAGLVLLWGALGKLLAPQVFLADLITYRLGLPDGALRLVVLVLPWLEAASGLLLLVRRHAPGALLVAGALFVIFAVATGQAVLRGLDLSCGCLDVSLLGMRSDSAFARLFDSAPMAFVRAAVLGSLCAFLLTREKRGFHPDTRG